MAAQDKKKLLSGAGVLALSVVIAKVLGAIYRVPLTNILGAEGMGLYQFVYPVFALLLTLSSGAVPTAVSITVSKYLSLSDAEGASRAFAVTLKLSLIFGSVGTAIMLIVAYPISLIQSRDAFFGYLSIAPAVLIVTVISAFRGYFMGKKNMIPGSVSQLSEGVVKLAVGIILAKILLPYGVKYAVIGALTGVVASELVTLIIMALTFLFAEKKAVRVKLRDNTPIIKDVLRILAPLVVCGLILPLSQFIDSVLLVNLLKLRSFDRATSLYGILSGVATPLINLPVMVCISLGVAITPQMVEGRVKRDVDYVMDKCGTATKMTFVLGVPFVFFYLFLSEGIVKLLYPALSGDDALLAGRILTILAPSLMGLSIFQIYSAMLQGLDKTVVPVKIMALCVGIKIVLSIVLVPTVGILGAAISQTVAYCLAGVIITVYFFNYVRITDEFAKNAGLITLCGVIMGFAVLMSDKLIDDKAGVIVACAVSGAVYIISLFALRVFDREELAALPLSKLLLKIDDKMR